MLKAPTSLRTMPKLRILIPTLAAALLGVLVLASPGLAAKHRSPHAKRSVPRNFFGTQFGEGALYNAPTRLQDPQVALMARSGVETMRAVFTWARAEPSPGAYNWATTDNIVTLAARHHLTLLPTVMFAPRWASAAPTNPNWANWPPTRDPRPYTDFLVKLVQRYGPKGSFWTAHRGLRRYPIRAWQIWNEPGFRYFFGDPAYRRSYPRLLRASYTAIKRADRHAQVVMAGLANSSSVRSWLDLNAFYRAGVRGHYDVLALHPYARSVGNMEKIIAANRRVLRARHDARKPIWLTEVTWTASKGKVHGRNRLGLEVTTRQQQRNLPAAYRALARHRRTYNVYRVYWWSWATTYKAISVNGSAPSFEFSGLTRATGSSFRPMRLLSVYRGVARQLEACSKTSTASCR